MHELVDAMAYPAFAWRIPPSHGYGGQDGQTGKDFGRPKRTDRMNGTDGSENPFIFDASVGCF
ncbi:MAG TPA: hypothetical protein VGY56_14060 [Verrucomicrobiae bacterium]|nr:hypothetical protein [Verrucomicrobiae bacterium]